MTDETRDGLILAIARWIIDSSQAVRADKAEVGELLSRALAENEQVVDAVKVEL